jgi:hypothetical protein
MGSRYENHKFTAALGFGIVVLGLLIVVRALVGMHVIFSGQGSISIFEFKVQSENDTGSVAVVIRVSALTPGVRRYEKKSWQVFGRYVNREKNRSHLKN